MTTKANAMGVSRFEDIKNGDNIEDGIANIEDGIQRNPPPTELAQKVFKTKPKIGTKKRKSNETEEATTA